MGALGPDAEQAESRKVSLGLVVTCPGQREQERRAAAATSPSCRARHAAAESGHRPDALGNGQAVIPDGLKACPRCGMSARYLSPDHLDRCGVGWCDGAWSEPPGVFLAR